MINSKKKGFTIVELVIVIAVIAVLAAVLIPTFSNLVKKANESADMQAVRQMNTVLVMADSKKELETFNDAQLALAEAGYNALESLTPISTGYKFYWLNEHDCIVLADKDNKVVFPENLKDLDLGKAIAELNVTNLKNAAEEIKAEVSTEDALIEAIKKGQEITLTNDVVVSSDIVITTDTVIKLAGNKISSPSTNRPFVLSNGVTLTIDATESGSVFECGKYGLANILSGANANLILKGGTYTANTDWGAFIKIRGGKSNVNVTLENVNYTDTSSGYRKGGYLMYCDGNEGKISLYVTGGSYKAYMGFHIDGDATIEGNTIITTEGFGVYCSNGTAKIKNSTFNVGGVVDNNTPTCAVAVSNNAVAEVNDCNINCIDNTPAIYDVYTSGGKIIASNNTVNNNSIPLYPAGRTMTKGFTGSITVNGTIVKEWK